MHDEAPAPSDSELPPAQAWTPKKRDISREVKVAKPAAISHALLGHDDSHSHASDSESGGKSKMLIIGGGIAAVAAIAAIVVFVVKPFGGSAAGGHSADDRRGSGHRHAVDRLDAAGPRVHRRDAEGHHAAAPRSCRPASTASASKPTAA